MLNKTHSKQVYHYHLPRIDFSSAAGISRSEGHLDNEGWRASILSHHHGDHPLFPPGSLGRFTAVPHVEQCRIDPLFYQRIAVGAVYAGCTRTILAATARFSGRSYILELRPRRLCFTFGPNLSLQTLRSKPDGMGTISDVSGHFTSKKANMCCSSLVRFQRRLHIRFHSRRPLLTAHLADASARNRSASYTNPDMPQTGPSPQASAHPRVPLYTEVCSHIDMHELSQDCEPKTIQPANVSSPQVPSSEVYIQSHVPDEQYISATLPWDGLLIVQRARSYRGERMSTWKR
jgi:hypothetical protein